MNKKILVAPSLLSADFARLGDEIRAVQRAGADWLHVDIMDGHFVPNITIGPFVVKYIKASSSIPLDAHLMIAQPEKFIKPFSDAGADIITFHIESCSSPEDLIKSIRQLGKKVGVSIKPKTELRAIRGILNQVDMVLVMTVEPGFAGQGFMSEVVPKIKDLRSSYEGDIQVDGGITKDTSSQVRLAGANILVAGTAVFGQKDYKLAIKDLRG